MSALLFSNTLSHLVKDVLRLHRTFAFSRLSVLLICLEITSFGGVSV